MKAQRVLSLIPRLLAAATAGMVLAGAALAQGFDAGSNGSLGDIVITNDTQIVLPPDGRLHYKSLQILENAYVSFARNEDEVRLRLTPSELENVNAVFFVNTTGELPSTAADALVTMNSTVAIDALALRLPALVVGLPNNLSPFVQAGAMVGADGADAIRRALESLLYDSWVRQRVLAAGAAFADRFALASDGLAAARSADAILGLAGSRAGVA